MEGLPLLSPEDFSDPGIKSRKTLQSKPPGKPVSMGIHVNTCIYIEQRSAKLAF